MMALMKKKQLLLCILLCYGLFSDAQTSNRQFALTLDGKETTLLQEGDEVKYDAEGNISMISASTSLMKWPLWGNRVAALRY